jgi:uncharacterized membrane protein
MNARTIGLIVAVVGVIVGLAFLFADVLGISIDPDTFGVIQIIGTVVGVVLVIAGGVLYFRTGKPES